MKTINDVKKILTINMDYIRDEFNVAKLAVFGSYVRNTQTKESDIDILVDFYDSVSIFEFLELEEYLEELLGVKIDLVSRKGLKPCIGQHILQEAIYI